MGDYLVGVRVETYGESPQLLVGHTESYLLFDLVFLLEHIYVVLGENENARVAPPILVKPNNGTGEQKHLLAQHFSVLFCALERAHALLRLRFSIILAFNHLQIVALAFKI